MNAPCHVGSDVLAVAFHSVQDGVEALDFHGIFPPELGVKISGVCRNVAEVIIDLVIESHILVVQVFHRDAAIFAERHGPIAVGSVAGVHADRQRIDRHGAFPLGPAAGKKVREGNLHRGVLFAVPIEAKDRPAPIAGWRHPDAADASRPRDVGQSDSGIAFDHNRRRNLPSLAQVARGLRAGALERHAALALFPREIFRADGARLDIFEAANIPQIAPRRRVPLILRPQSGRDDDPESRGHEETKRCCFHKYIFSASKTS